MQLRMVPLGVAVNVVCEGGPYDGHILDDLLPVASVTFNTHDINTKVVYYVTLDKSHGRYIARRH